MFYIDTKEQPLVANDKSGITVANNPNKSNPLDNPFKQGYKDLSYLLGVTLELFPERVKSALREMNLEANNKREAVDGMAYLSTTPQFGAFLNKINDKITDALYTFVSPKQVADTATPSTKNSKNMESNWSSDNTASVITGTSTIVGSVFGWLASDKQKQAAEEMAKLEMQKGALEADRLRQQMELEKLKIEAANAQRAGGKSWVVPVIVVGVLLVIGVIVTIVVIRKKKASGK